MAQETRRIPAFLTGPTTPTAVLFPMRLFAGYWWLASGLQRLRDGWLSGTDVHLPNFLNTFDAPNWFEVTFFGAASENVLLFQWLIVLAEVVFGAMLMIGAVTRVAGVALTLMATTAFIAHGYPADGWYVPMGLVTLTLAIAAAGRYLGLDAILRARMVKVPLF
ncbi:DoxX family membrane protein [Planctomycetota bacterium]|nr:DoxX family membrane protein [Planctomycetota bacterium]